MLFSSPNALAGGLVSLLLFPWLNPVASGPSPSVFPWLMATACSVALWSVRANLSVRHIAVTWLWAAVISSAIGLLQYFGYTQGLQGWVHHTGLGDAFANLRQRNQFATLTSMGLVALLWCESQSVDSIRPFLNRQRVFRVAAMLILALGNASSSSRTGMLQWCLILALTLLWGGKAFGRVKILSALALLAYVTAAIALPKLLEVWTETPAGGLLARFVEEPGCSSRRVLWSNVWYLIAQKPWLGWGWGELDYAHLVTLYPGERFCEILDNAHNLPLHLAVELGLPAAGVLLGLFAWWLVGNRPWAEQNPTRQMAWAVLAVMGLHSLLEYPLWYGPFQLAVGLCVFLLWRTRPEAVSRSAAQEPAGTSAPSPGVVTWLVAVLLLSALSAAAWDYWRVSQLYLLPADRAVAYRDNTLEKVRGSWFFKDQVQFAELTTVIPTRENAAQHYTQALRLLHFSPEPRVIEAVIESAVLLGKDPEALYFLQRYRAAFPDAHATWVAQSARYKTP